MDPPKNVAHNAALRENAFMMVVCIENRLPLFLVGKPGSSKSLAKSVVSNAMLGRNSSSTLFSHFKQVLMFPYQCSQYTTSMSIMGVFKDASDFQHNMTSEKMANFISVIVLEEVGLAEASPKLPLKILHPYLEDGTAGLDVDEEDVSPEKRVAFIGISNWALDPAKMNRAIMVTRIPPDESELTQTASAIATSIDSELSLRLKQYFKPLAQMFQTICELSLSQSEDGHIKREFFGLRDYYSLIKMLCSIYLETGQDLTLRQLEYAVKRNFSGGLELDPVNCIPNLDDLKTLCRSPNSIESQPDCTGYGLVKAALRTFENPSTEISGRDGKKVLIENRHLLLLTENNSALHIIQSHLLIGKEPFVLYGSSFPKDQHYTQVCRNINQIKVQMETGNPVVLLNLENIYESLYDLLNQCYTVLPKGRYVDLGLRNDRIKCRVHENFRLIIIANRDKVFQMYPVALINRLEKHFVLSSSVLTIVQERVVENLHDKVKRFSTIAHHSSRSATNLHVMFPDVISVLHQ